MTEELTTALIEAIHAANLARFEANAAHPYDHSVYENHANRVRRLVAALADGNEQIEYRFNDALYDIVWDGLEWMKKVYAEIKEEHSNAQ